MPQLTSRLFLFSRYPDNCTPSTHVITSRFPLVCRCISDNRWSWAALQGAKSDIPRTVSETSFRSVSLSRSYGNLHRLTSASGGFPRTRAPSCLLPRGIEKKCADNAHAFSGVIKGLNPRSCARSTTLILSTTSSEPATRQAINSCYSIPVTRLLGADFIGYDATPRERAFALFR